MFDSDDYRRLAELEQIARKLDPGCETRLQHEQRVMDYANAYLDGVEHAPAYQYSPDKAAGLLDYPLVEGGIGLDQALELVGRFVDRQGIAPTSGRFTGYIPGGGLFHAALGDFLAAVSNRYAGVFFASPGAVRIENQLVRWMARLVGLPEGASGYLSAGGSGATLAAIVTARDARGISGEKISRAVVYVTEHTHHCVDKAMHIAGLDAVQRRHVAADEGFRMCPDALAAAIRKDRQKGLLPWMLLLSAGTTNTGSVDPLSPLGQIAAREDLWLHVDAAYGGFFLLTDEGREKLAGIEQADSIVMDPHKTLFLPYGSGALLVRDGSLLKRAHRGGADYLQDTLGSLDEDSPADLSPELTKHFRGLRMWLPLQVLGLAPFRAALTEKLLLARYFHAQMAASDLFEVGPLPDLSVVTFRQKGDDRLNQCLVEALQRDGRIFLSSTRLEGRFTLRMAVVCHRTHLAQIDTTIQVLHELAARVSRA
ncbi:MAG: aminotransferase class I/II-fold pyridoxal phosphate-dependent enzyme [Wenzhouxiangellaceae bacterium]|nr:aminotransferase class I/II-fold pyridoxal phosphate-dependent enzyme [Wenzhouxiangellaceae bacterium]